MWEVFEPPPDNTATGTIANGAAVGSSFNPNLSSLDMSVLSAATQNRNNPTSNLYHLLQQQQAETTLPVFNHATDNLFDAPHFMRENNVFQLFSSSTEDPPTALEQEKALVEDILFCLLGVRDGQFIKCKKIRTGGTSTSGTTTSSAGSSGVNNNPPVAFKYEIPSAGATTGGGSAGTGTTNPASATDSAANNAESSGSAGNSRARARSGSSVQGGAVPIPWKV